MLYQNMLVILKMEKYIYLNLNHDIGRVL